MPAPQVTGEKGLGALPEQRATVAQAWPCSTEQSSSAERSHPRPPSALPTTSRVRPHLLPDLQAPRAAPALSPPHRHVADQVSLRPSQLSRWQGGSCPVWAPQPRLHPRVWVQVEKEGAAEPSPLQGFGRISTTAGRALCSQEALPDPEGARIVARWEET